MDEFTALFSRKDMTFEEAVAYFKERVPVTASRFYQIAAEYRARGGPLRGDVIGGGQMGERHKRTFFLSKRLRYDDTEAFCVWQDKF